MFWLFSELFEFYLFTRFSNVVYFFITNIWVNFISSRTKLWAIILFIPFQRLVMINELLWRYCRRMAWRWLRIDTPCYVPLCARPVLHFLCFMFFFIYVSSSLRNTQCKTLRWTHRSKINWSPDNCLVFSLWDVYTHED